MQPLRRETGKHDYRAELFELIRTRSFGRGRIMLASGRESDYYIDMRPTTVHPAGATCVGELIVDALEGLRSISSAGSKPARCRSRPRPRSRATAAAATSARSSCARRRRITAPRRLVEGLPKGESLRGKNIVVVEDVTTTGGSSMQAIAVAARGGRQHRLRARRSWTGSKARRRTSRQEGSNSARSIRRMNF